jgi:hypothetical protein
MASLHGVDSGGIQHRFDADRMEFLDHVDAGAGFLRFDKYPRLP